MADLRGWRRVRGHAACTRAAFDAGINVFDTANVYGRGTAESAWGQILSGYRREDYVLATKVFPMSEDDRGLSAPQIRKQIDASLRRLRTDHVDLYQCHRFDAETPIEETMEALAEVVRAGKARYLGFSEWTPDQIRAGLAARTRRRHVRVRAAAVLDAVAGARDRGVRADPPAQRLTDETLTAVQRLVPIAEQAGLSMAQLALAWVLRRPELASAVIGAIRPDQVHANATAAGIELSGDTLAAIDDALGSAPVTGHHLAPGATEGITHR